MSKIKCNLRVGSSHFVKFRQVNMIKFRKKAAVFEQPSENKSNASNELSKHWLFSHPVFFSSIIISANKTTKPSRQQVKLKTYEYYSSVVDFSWPRSMKLRSALLLSCLARLFVSTKLIPITRCVGCCARNTYWILPLKSKQSWEHTIETHGLLCIENHIRVYYRASRHKQYSNIRTKRQDMSNDRL